MPRRKCSRQRLRMTLKEEEEEELEVEEEAEAEADEGGETYGWVRPPLNPPTVVLPRRAGPPPSKFKPFALGHLFGVSASLLLCRGVRKITNPLIWHRAASSSIFVKCVRIHNDRFNHLARPSSSIFA